MIKEMIKNGNFLEMRDIWLWEMQGTERNFNSKSEFIIILIPSYFEYKSLNIKYLS